jgi:hypothetical protein
MTATKDARNGLSTYAEAVLRQHGIKRPRRVATKGVHLWQDGRLVAFLVTGAASPEEYYEIDGVQYEVISYERITESDGSPGSRSRSDGSELTRQDVHTDQGDGQSRTRTAISLQSPHCPRVGVPVAVTLGAGWGAGRGR